MQITIYVLLLASSVSLLTAQDNALELAAAEQESIANHYEQLQWLRNEHLPLRAGPIPGKEWECQERDKQISFTKDSIVISLGYNCACARQFERHRLSEAFFPFDWCKSTPETIYQALHNSFAGYLEQENLSVITSNTKYHEVLDARYKVQFVHDFKVDGPLWHDYQAVKTKYERRIARFLWALTLGKPIYFFRTVISKQEALDLNILLRSLFPNLHYTLVVMHDTDEFKEDWHVPGIKNFFLQEPTIASYTALANSQWDTIFKTLKLIT